MENNNSLETIDLESAKKYIVELRAESAERRKNNEKLENQINELKLNIDKMNETKNTENQEVVNKYDKTITDLENKLKSLTLEKKDFETKLSIYKENELKEIEDIKSSFPDEIKEIYKDNTNKKELLALKEIFNQKKSQNSQLSEIDNIIDLAKKEPNKLTVEQEALLAQKDPDGYKNYVKSKFEGLAPKAVIR